jgi:hypothetical protein
LVRVNDSCGSTNLETAPNLRPVGMTKCGG